MMAVQIFHGDCLEVLPLFYPSSVDAIVTDPPYGLSFMGKDWDHGVPGVPFWSAMLRVLKPGGHLIAFGGTRTSHRMVCAIEDAGFEIRDSLMFLYGTGFPKSHSVALDFEKTLCERVKNAEGVLEWRYLSDGELMRLGEWRHPDAIEWASFGSALKPAFEPIVLARKPLGEPTVAANVLKWRTGALNIGATRIGNEIVGWGGARGGSDDDTQSQGRNYRLGEGEARPVEGRWPANLVTDGSDEVVGMFPRAKGAFSNGRKGKQGLYEDGIGTAPQVAGYGDSGSTARFFYSAKASKADRAGSRHPTVKPVSLMRWLCRLVTPPGGVVLDPFAGSGTTGAAAVAEGFEAVLVEREEKYVEDIRRRFPTPLDPRGDGSYAGPDDEEV